MCPPSPADALYFGTYEPSKQFLLRALPDSMSSAAHVAAAAGASLLSSVIRAPTEVVKQRLQVRA